MPIHELPDRPNLEHLKNQARALLREAEAGDAAAQARFRESGLAGAPKLADALHVVAREYGFATWPALKLDLTLRSAEPMEALEAAVRAGDAGLVRQVLASHPVLGSRLNEPLPGDAFGATALIVAVQREDRGMVEVLLDAGADANARSHWWAGSFGVLDSASPELASLLIARGATVDLHAAARLGFTERVRELLASEPELVQARGGDGQLPLHFAATVEIAGLLLEAGAEIDARDLDHESTAAQYMTAHRPTRHEVARFLLSRGAEADLLMVAALGDRERVEQILDDDPETVRLTVSDRHFPKKDPRSGGSIYFFGFGWTQSPHMLAHRFEHPEVLALLMQRSPNWLRLVYAAELGDEATFRRILAGHPQLFQKLSGNAARRLLGVAVRNNTSALEMLVRAGWPAGAVMDTGETALHFAAFHGNVAMVRELIAYGAAVNAVESKHGGTPLSWAMEGSLHSWHRHTGDYAAVVRALLAAGATPPESEHPLEGTDEVLEALREGTS